MVNSLLDMGQQCAQVARKASSVLTYIGGGVAVRTREVMGALYLALVRPRIVYCVRFWAPHYRKNIEFLEHVQIAAVKLVKGLKSKTYKGCISCGNLGLSSLEKRSMRGDLITL